MRVAYNKLVRDQIPDIIAAAGNQPSTRDLDQASYQRALRSKLLEEAQEAEAAADEQLAGGFDRRIFLEHVAGRSVRLRGRRRRPRPDVP